jgi:hypothetical protein
MDILWILDIGYTYIVYIVVIWTVDKKHYSWQELLIIERYQTKYMRNVNDVTKEK